MSISDETEEVTLAPVEFDDNALDEWIAGGDITKSLIVMHGKPYLAAEYQKVEDDLRLAIATGADEGQELAGGEIGRLRARKTAIYEEWQASRSRWTVRAFSDEIIDQAEEATIDALGPEPVPPKEPAKGSPQSKHDDYAVKLAKFQKANKLWQDRNRAEGVMRIVERIEFADGRVGRVSSADQVLRMRKTFGEQQILKIFEAGTLSRMAAPELKAPFSSSTSQDDQT